MLQARHILCAGASLVLPLPVLRGRAGVGVCSRRALSRNPHPNPPPEYREREKKQSTTIIYVAIVLALAVIFTSTASAEDRAQRFPAPDFRSGYSLPQTQTPRLPWAGWQAVDVLMLATALSLAAWFVLKKRSRAWTLGLTIGSLLYFGFWRKGCICPVGSIQNVAWAAAGHGYALPWTVAAFFLLPLLFSLYFGRVFCSGVCPLGAAQDLVLFKPLRVPTWLESALGLGAWAYLGLAVLFASAGSDFVICRYDPFVGFFRLGGPAHMLVAGALLLILCMFIGRAYCRFLCPYSVPLRLLAPFARKQVSITPTNCIDCRLCEQSCPFGAIRYPSPKQTARRQRMSRRFALTAAAAAPALIIAFAILAYPARNSLARLDFTVRLAEQVTREQTSSALIQSDEVKAFHATGQSTQQLYAAAEAIQRRFTWGAPIFGAWIGLAIWARLIAPIFRRRRSDYHADASACVACARCFASCPAELRTVEKQAELVAA